MCATPASRDKRPFPGLGAHLFFMTCRIRYSRAASWPPNACKRRVRRFPSSSMQCRIRYSRAASCPAGACNRHLGQFPSSSMQYVRQSRPSPHASSSSTLFATSSVASGPRPWQSHSSDVSGMRSTLSHTCDRPFLARAKRSNLARGGARAMVA